MGLYPPITPPISSFLGGQNAECVRYGQKGFTYEFEFWCEQRADVVATKLHSTYFSPRRGLPRKLKLFKIQFCLKTKNWLNKFQKKSRPPQKKSPAKKII